MGSTPWSTKTLSTSPAILTALTTTDQPHENQARVSVSSVEEPILEYLDRCAGSVRDPEVNLGNGAAERATSSSGRPLGRHALGLASPWHARTRAHVVSQHRTTNMARSETHGHAISQEHPHTYMQTRCLSRSALSRHTHTHTPPTTRTRNRARLAETRYCTQIDAAYKHYSRRRFSGERSSVIVPSSTCKAQHMLKSLCCGGGNVDRAWYDAQCIRIYPDAGAQAQAPAAHVSMRVRHNAYAFAAPLAGAAYGRK